MFGPPGQRGALRQCRRQGLQIGILVCQRPVQRGQCVPRGGPAGIGVAPAERQQVIGHPVQHGVRQGRRCQDLRHGREAGCQQQGGAAEGSGTVHGGLVGGGSRKGTVNL